MSELTNRRQVTISTFDLPRLQELLLVAKQHSSTPPPYIQVLEEELQRAAVVAPEEIPPYTVTMNTRVKLLDPETGRGQFYTLVFPNAADAEVENLSILSDLGVAILGYCVGDTFEWDFPEGRKQIRVDMIEFQPEATKQYEM